MTGNDIIAVVFYISGRVQMVGFRATSNEYAGVKPKYYIKGYGKFADEFEDFTEDLPKLGGFVRNTLDGKVQLLLIGKKKDVDTCVFKLEQKFDIRTMDFKFISPNCWDTSKEHTILY